MTGDTAPARNSGMDLRCSSAKANVGTGTTPGAWVSALKKETLLLRATKNGFASSANKTVRPA